MISSRTKVLFFGWIAALFVLAILFDLANWPNIIYGIIVILWEMVLAISAFDDIATNNC